MWYTKFGNMGDVVLSTRVRLARNLKNTPFPNRADKTQQEEIINTLKSASAKIEDARFFDLSNMPDREKKALAERHIISPLLTDGSIKRGLVLSDDQRISIMLMEEDHLRIQAMHEGFAVEECLKSAMDVDDTLEESLDYAFSEKLGYLTCCPTNVGTGLRISVMVCLPGITMAGRIDSLSRSLSKMGIAVRGIFGEGSQSLGNIYQISNQVTLGITEEETAQKLTEIVSEIISQERSLQQKIYLADKFRIEDKVMRALGTLKYSRIMGSGEALGLISDVRLGINVGIIKETDLEKLSEILYSVLPATLSATYNIETPADRDVKRAEVIREKLG